MKNSPILLAIFLLIASSCAEKLPNSDNYQKDSFCTVKEEIEKTNFDGTDDESENSNNNEKEEDMIDISNLFSTDELDKIRNNYISQLRFNFSFRLGDEMALLSEDKELKDTDFVNHEITDEEKSENMDVIYRVFSEKYSIFKPVSKELFEEKMKSVFDIDINDKNVYNSFFYTNFAMHSIYAVTSCYAIYIDLKNHIISLGDLPLSFKEEIDWDGFYKKLENLDQEHIEYYDTKIKLYKEYLNEASQKKYTIYCSKQKMEYLFHINNYVFHDSKASLSWLLNNTPECIDTPFLNILFEFFNYDKEPRINRNNFCFDISKGFPLKSDRYKSLFGEVESCSQTQYYNYFKFKVRTGMMQYVVDNCYDETDLDTFGIRKDKLICIMEDCFDYLFEYVLQGDKYKESNEGPNYQVEYHTYQGCHYYQVCAYLAYYLTKAHEKFVSYGQGDPRCWHNALVNNLREDLKNNDAHFENYVKENNYFNLEGFEQIMKDAHDQAMAEP